MTPTARVVHAAACCPDCGAPLAGGTLKRTREVIEVPVVPVVVTEHVYLERRCPDCRRRCVPPPDLAGLACGRSRLGIGLVSLIAVVREEARLPFATIQQVLGALHGLDLSVGALVGALGQVVERAEPVVEQIRASIRASPVVHADETAGAPWAGENGTNGYVWTFSTPTARYFVRGSREKAVLEAALGANFAGVLVSDFYGAYTNYEGRHQYCWAHLLRDAAELADQHRAKPAVIGWAAALHDLYARARAFCHPDLAARRRAQRGFEAELRALGVPYLGDQAAPQRVLCERIARHLAELFVFVADPAVPPTNNAAERSLRHLVTSRKISGGTRSAAGSATKMALATVFGTWRAQALDPLAECRTLLAATQV